MARAKLNVSIRNEVGTTAVRRLRDTGMIPGVIYGKAKKAIPVQVSIKDIHGVEGADIAENVLLDLTVKDEKGKSTKTVIIKEVQKNCLKGNWLHIDFNEISMEEKLKTKVAIDVTGDSVGVAQGGILDQIMHELEIECLPADIPPHIKIDVTSLTIGQTVYVKDLVIPPRVAVLSNLEMPVVSVSAPKEEEEVVAAPAEGEAAEPEVIKKGKKEEEGEEAEKGAEAKPEAKAKEEPKGKEERKPAKEEKKEK